MADTLSTPPTPPQLQGKDALIAYFQPRSSQAEAFRQLRTAIQFYDLDHPVRSVLVTSTGPDEGKSSTVANLAITLAQAGHKVALVDCDLRHPSLHHLFGIENSSGLASLFLEGSSLEGVLRESGVPDLRVLPGGPLPPNPAELLGSTRMEEILVSLRATAEYVLLDTPPVVPVTDAAVLAPHVDGVLLVLKAGKTKREMAQRAKALLEKAHARLLGVVLNNAKLDAGIKSYYADQGGRRS